MIELMLFFVLGLITSFGEGGKAGGITTKVQIVLCQ